MTKRLLRYGLMTGLFAVLPLAAWAQNTTSVTSVHLLVGQPPMVVTLPTATPDRYYDATVVAGRSYCAEATGAETEVNQTDPVLALLHTDGTTALAGVVDTGNREPAGQTAARMCFIAGTTETVYIKISPFNSSFANLAYAVRFVETTLWANWYFVAGDYSSFALVRNTTNAAVTATFAWRDTNGAQVTGSPVTRTVPADGIVFINVREVLGCVGTPCPSAQSIGSVEVAHNGSPEAIVGSATTLAVTTGLSFDTIFFQRRAW